MGRRNRRRAAADLHNPRPPVIPDRQARVKVPDEVWRDFRLATQTESVGDALGRLVTREVERWRGRRIRQGTADDQEVLDALQRAQTLQAELAAIVGYLERRREASQRRTFEDEW
jgi:hypothetical protein